MQPSRAAAVWSALIGITMLVGSCTFPATQPAADAPPATSQATPAQEAAPAATATPAAPAATATPAAPAATATPAAPAATATPAAPAAAATPPVPAAAATPPGSAAAATPPGSAAAATPPGSAAAPPSPPATTTPGAAPATTTPDAAQPLATPAAMHLRAILTQPRSIVFQETGETATLSVIGIFENDSDQPLEDFATEAAVFRSTDPDVATVDANGLVTAVAPGGIDIQVEYGGLRATATIIVYAPFIQVPPHDPDREREWNGVRLIVNRLIVAPATDTYDAALTVEIAADYDAEVLAEWRNLNEFLLEFPGVYEVPELIAIAERMDDDDRIAAYQADKLWSAD